MNDIKPQTFVESQEKITNKQWGWKDTTVRFEIEDFDGIHKIDYCGVDLWLEDLDYQLLTWKKIIENTTAEENSVGDEDDYNKAVYPRSEFEIACKITWVTHKIRKCRISPLKFFQRRAILL